MSSCTVSHYRIVSASVGGVWGWAWLMLCTSSDYVKLVDPGLCSGNSTLVLSCNWSKICWSKEQHLDWENVSNHIFVHVSLAVVILGQMSL